MSAIKEARAKADRILKDKAAELADLVQQKARIQKEIEKAEKKMRTAEDNGEEDDYRAALKEKNEAADVLQMYTNRQNKLQNKPLLDKTEYERLVSAVKSEVASEEKKARQDIGKLIEDMEIIINALRATSAQANETLHILQHDIYRDEDRLKTSSGKVVEIPHQIQHVDITSTIAWVSKMTNSDIYKNIKRG